VNSLTALDWQIVAKSACAGWGLTMVGMPVYLMGMRKLGWGQPIREEGPKDHQVKSGTPTMGGGLFVPMGLLASLWAGHYSANLVCLWLVTLGGWLLGLTDDLMKVMKNRNLGLKARQKVAIQTLVALGCALFVAFSSDNPAVKIPGLGLWAGILPVVLIGYFVIVGTSNAVNVTDGQDGLAAGTVAASLVCYSAVCLHQGRVDLAVGAAGLLGSCVGFLWYNCYPARIFMGDTGSLGLGCALGSLAMMTHTEFLLVVVGGVFVMETLSVASQVAYFKVTKKIYGEGRRIFRMSPIHHHFCMGGLHEVQVTTRFWVASWVLAAVGFYLYIQGVL
jgi:phospho-N-acetylmuramoyl-pentapeptide-transferase